MNDRAKASEPSAESAAMTGWAQLLHDVVERRLRPGGPADLLAPSWDTMFDDALATVMQQMVRTRVEELTPEGFLAAYRSVHGDAALLTELDRVVEARAQQARREEALLRLAADARVAGRLRLAALDAGETVDIGLFDPTHPGLAAWRFRANAEVRPLHRELRARITSPATGGVRVVTDTWTGAVWAERWRTPHVEAMAAARLGTPLPDATDPLPDLTWHAPVVVVLDSGATHAPPQIVGYVRTLDGRLLLDAPSPRRH